MSNKTIKDYADAGGIDASADYFLVQQNSTNTYRRITRNVMLGTTGTPVDTTSVQTIQNKVLDNTNTLTIKDTLFTLQDDGDTTKRANFQLSGITTGTTRTYTLPNASSTIADISTTQTFTNKTLTSPVITGGSIDNSTITVDTISGHTTPNSGTVYGMSVTAGTLSSTAILNKVNTAAIQNNAVTYAKLLATIFSGQVLTQANAGTAGGTMSYINLGGVKLLWIITPALTSSAAGSAGYTVTFPTSFFASIQAATATAINMTADVRQYAAIQVVNSVTLTFALVAPGAATTGATIFVIGQ